MARDWSHCWVLQACHSSWDPARWPSSFDNSNAACCHNGFSTHKCTVRSACLLSSPWLSEGQHVSFLQGYLMAGPFHLGLCLINEVYDNLRLSGAFTLVFPFLWHQWVFILCELAAAFSNRSKDTWSQRLAQRECGQPKMLMGSLLAGLTLNSSVLAYSSLWLFPTFQEKGEADNRKFRPCKGFCPPHL